MKMLKKERTKITKVKGLPKDVSKWAHILIDAGPKNTSKRASRNNNRGTDAPENYLKSVVKQRDLNQEDIDTIKSILPETSLIERIVTSLIMSPNSLSGEGITFVSSSSEQKTQEILADIKDKLLNVYKMDDLAEEVCGECLFGSGAMPMMILPETTISKAVRQGLKNPTEYSLESSKFTNVNFLRPRGGAKTENKSANLESAMGIEIVADPNQIHLSKHYDIENSKAMDDMMAEFLGTGASNISLENGTVSLESNKVTQVNDSINIITSAKHDYNEHRELSLGFEADGDGFTGYANAIRPTARSVVPVVSHNDPANAIGYYVLMDSQGRPLQPLKGEDLYKTIKDSKSSMSDLYSSLGLENKALGSGGDKGTQRKLMDSYEEAFNTVLRERLTNAALYDNVEVDIKLGQSILETMLWRSMKKRSTKVLFVPAAYMTYFAFKHNDDGTGRSLIEDNKIAAMQYATLLFAYNLAAIKNSTPHRTLTIDLDGEDPDPETTVRDVTDQSTKNMIMSSQPGSMHPTDIMSSLQSLNMSVKVNPNGSPYPETSVEMVTQTTISGEVDTEFLEKVRNRYIMGFWISPSWVDMSSPVEFSRSIANESMLTAQRIAMLQRKLEDLLTNMVRQVILYSSSIIKVIDDALGRKDDVLKRRREWVDSITVELPRANVNHFEANSELLNSYIDILTTTLDNILSNENVSSAIFGDNATDLEDYIPVIRGILIRKFMVNNNIMPEVTQLLELSDDTIEELGFETNRINELTKAVSKVVERARKKGSTKKEEEAPTTPEPASDAVEEEPESDIPTEEIEEEVIESDDPVEEEPEEEQP